MKKRAIYINASAWLFLGAMITPIAQAQDTLILKGSSVGVGVQETPPPTTFHVRDTDSSKAGGTLARLTGSGFYPQFELENEKTGETWRLGANSANQFEFNETSDLSSVQLRISPNGEFFVNGSKKHADYVFASDYKLMPLDDLEEYIQEHQHLPNVLNAAEREAQGGIDLSSFPVQLLEKIEELVLYTIEQNRQIERLSTQGREIQSISEENQRLAERLDALESERN